MTLAHHVVRRHPPTSGLLGYLETTSASAISEHALSTFRGCRSNRVEPYGWGQGEEPAGSVNTRAIAGIGTLDRRLSGADIYSGCFPLNE
jgi:hypothetical protein